MCIHRRSEAKVRVIEAKNKSFDVLNDEIYQSGDELKIVECLGQRFIASGSRGKRIVISGVPGNALGAYLAGSEIIVEGNAQDAVGDTMNDGLIVIHGNVGDAVGYAMRGGIILVQGNAGYRVGIHMKEYKEKKPAIVIGGRVGSFLGEYQAGGRIVALGLHKDDKETLGAFPCAGMHGGKLFVRGGLGTVSFPEQTTVKIANPEDLAEIRPLIAKFCETFGYDFAKIIDEPFTLVTPNVANPYKQMYVAN